MPDALRARILGSPHPHARDCVDGRRVARTLDGHLVPTFADAPRMAFIAVRARMPDATAHRLQSAAATRQPP